MRPPRMFWTRFAGLNALLLIAASQAAGAMLTNRDARPFVFTLTEGGDRTEVTVATGETLEFCLDGCFVVLPNGSRAALAGDEVIEVSGGRITTM
jgi:hypothetical protein